MKARLSLFLLLLVTLSSCSITKPDEEPSPDSIRYFRLQELIGRIGSANFQPFQEESMYPFTFVFRKAGAGEIIRQGDGFVLIHGPLWCLVQRWKYYYPEGTEQMIHDSKTWPLYEALSWNENGMLVRISRFTNSSVLYSYEGLKLKLIEFSRNKAITAFADFTYQ
jgi:hypothetical protein